MTVEERRLVEDPRTGRAGTGIGLIAGMASIACCVYPVVVFLIGAATASEAIALGDLLYGRWGWVFKIAGAGFGVAAVGVHLRRHGECSLAGARRSWRFLARVMLVAAGTYWIVYGVTKLLAVWGR